MQQELGMGCARSGSGDGGSVFRLEGEYWTITYNGVVCRLRDTAGLRCIAHLLRRPGEKVAAAQLAQRSIASEGARARSNATANSELVRVKTTRAIRAAMQRIGTHNAPLIEHLRATIKTGTFCSYAPDPRLPVEWQL
jgi:hypothetical protein